MRLVYYRFFYLIRRFNFAAVMKRALCIFILVSVFLINNSFAQSSEFGLSIGASGYKGDLNQTMFNTKLINFPAWGLHFRRCINNYWSYKAQLNFLRIDAADSLSGDDWQHYRNLSFKSKIQELTFQFEFNFFGFQAANQLTKFSPYITSGISVFHFNPKAELNGEWFALQPLGTEGQGSSKYSDRKKYKRVSAAIAIGGGIKARLTDRFSIALEVAARRAYNDYLDDVSRTYASQDAIAASNGHNAALLSDRTIDQPSQTNTDRQRGNRNDKDWYYFACMQINFVLSKKYYDNCRPFGVKLK